MPNYYGGYTNPYGVGAAYFNPYTQQQIPQVPMSGAQQNPQYMIQVDGEMAARAWQAPSNLPPRTMIPLWDYDGEHVYFKSVDEYGRMNPMRKGRVIFEDEQRNLPQGQSQHMSGNEQLSPTPGPDMSNFVTKDDLNSLKEELREMMSQRQNISGSINNLSSGQGNQNGSNLSENNGKRR